MPGTFSRAVVRVMNLERTLLFFRSCIFPSRMLTLLLLPSLFPNRLSFSLSLSLSVCLLWFPQRVSLCSLSGRATSVAQKKIDDARGTWGHIDFKT